MSGLEKAKGKGIGHLSFGSESRTQALPLFSFFTRMFSNSSRSILLSVFSFQQGAGGAHQRDCVVGLTQSPSQIPHSKAPPITPIPQPTLAGA